MLGAPIFNKKGGADLSTREAVLAETFLILADTLVADFDPIEVLTLLTERCVELLGATASGVVLADAQGCYRHAFVRM